MYDGFPVVSILGFEQFGLGLDAGLGFRIVVLKCGYSWVFGLRELCDVSL